MIRRHNRSYPDQKIVLKSIFLFTFLSLVGSFLIIKFWSQVAGIMIAVLLLTCVAVVFGLYFYQESLFRKR